MISMQRFSSAVVHKLQPENHNSFMDSPILESNDYVPDSPIICDDDFKPCHVCSRKFNPDTLKKHVRICEKTTTRKRKPFDSYRQRREGTDLADFLPKNFGLPGNKQCTIESKPQQIPQKPVALQSPSIRRASEPTIKPTTVTTIKSEPHILRASKRFQGPATEECPICKRNFGIRAFDRHVEWCKEKARITPNKSVTPNAAKERLEARIKYRAPIVKSKRELNREKYSGLSCSESTNSLSDIGSGERSTSQSEERERKISLTASMTSSFNSDGGLRDKYDPFISAKRQLEELFPPLVTSSSKPHPQPNAQMTKSLTIKSPCNLTSPIIGSNTKSNFRRSSSLRISKKTTKPLYSPVYVKPSNIQRGISDEGPISTNFMKPEEYDELPVKSHAIITPELVPKSPRESLRQISTTATMTTCTSTPTSTITTPLVVVKRDHSASANRRNLRLDLKETTDFSLAKTDSLATFLKYEHDLNCSPSLTEKEKKDKSNSLNKQTYSKTVLSNILNNQNNDKSTDSTPTNPFFTTRKYNSIKLTPLDRTFHGNFNMSSISSTPHSEYDSNYIDPKLINICDNLPMDRTEKPLINTLTESNTNKDCSMLNNLNNDVDSNKSLSQRSNDEKRCFNRQLKLNKENFLYESNSTKDPSTGRECYTKSNLKNDIDSDPQKTITDHIDSLFNDFDFDEFITSFDDDDQYPIFKDYKEKLLNREKIKREISVSNSSDTSLEDDTKKLSENIENISVPITSNSIQNIKVTPSSGTYQITHSKVADCSNDSGHLKKNISRSNTNEFNDQYSTIDLKKYPDDSDELSSGNNSYKNTRTPATKLSADSAYGSLSRHSHNDRTQRRIVTRQQRQQIPDIICNKIINPKNTKTTNNKIDQPKKIESSSINSLSSSSSESSLPPIITKQKLETGSSQQILVGKEIPKLSKFCHACGNRFIFVEAKFCTECGARRMILD